MRRRGSAGAGSGGAGRERERTRANWNQLGCLCDPRFTIRIITKLKNIQRDQICSATRSSVPGPWAGSMEGKIVPAALLPGHKGGALQPAARLPRSPWIRAGGWRELWKCRRGNGGHLETSRSGTRDGLLGASSAFLSNLEPVIPSACTESSNSDRTLLHPAQIPAGVTAAS